MKCDPGAAYLLSWSFLIPPRGRQAPVQDYHLWAHSSSLCKTFHHFYQWYLVQMYDYLLAIRSCVTKADPDCFFVKVRYLLFYMVHFTMNTFFKSIFSYCVKYIVLSCRFFPHPDSPLLSPLLLSACFKEQVSTTPWGPVIECSEGRTGCQSLIKNATENTYIIQITF